MIHWAEAYFSSKGFEHPRQEIEWFLQEVLDCSRVDVYLRFEELLTPPQLEILRGWIRRRIGHEPLQYITGKTEFYGRVFQVNPEVLIPRPETERVVDVALHMLAGMHQPKVLDVGTGSGCIAISIGAEKPDTTITALDISPTALTVARENARNLQVAGICFLEADILKTVPPGPFDMLVSNPPYIPGEEIPILTAEIQDYEPHLALTDGGDGLSFYRHFARLAPRLLAEGGWLVLEVGLGEHPARAAAVFEEAGFSTPELIADFSGHQRVLKVALN